MTDTKIALVTGANKGIGLQVARELGRLRNELRGTAIKVNAANPGYCATDLNGHQGFRSVEQGAKSVVDLATLSQDGPTGGFFGDQGRLPW